MKLLHIIDIGILYTSEKIWEVLVYSELKITGTTANILIKYKTTVTPKINILVF